ncbi:MAG: hypothetical protein ACYDIA_17865 [Candidatus Humimicrobiaceae bacterium]
MICESKNYNTGFTDSTLKEILEKINRKKSLENKDEIVIICSKCNTNIIKRVKNLRFYKKELEEYLKNKNFSVNIESLLLKTNIWEIKENIIGETVFSLFYEIIGFWLPEEEIGRITSNILINRFYKGSAKGEIYKKEDIYNEIRLLAKKIRESSTYFQENENNFEKKISPIIKIIKKQKIEFGSFEFEALTQDRGLMLFLFDKLSIQKDISLSNLDILLKASNTLIFKKYLFDLLKNNLDKKENRSYVINFIDKELQKLNSYYYEDFLENDLSEIFNLIIEKDKDFNLKIFKIIERQFDLIGEKIFYIEIKKNLFYQQKDLCDILKVLYENSDNILKSEIINFTVSKLNLISDDDDGHNHFSPESAFLVLKEFIIADDNKHFKERFSAVVKYLVLQYERYENFLKEKDFDGWDCLGSCSVFWGNNYKVSDKYFIRNLLISCLLTLDSEDRWNFVKKNCIFYDNFVSKSTPDFLNRASIPIIINEYKKGNEEALQYLKYFLFSKKGIPAKRELVLQYLKNDQDLTEKQKWFFVNLMRKKYKILISPFLEMMLSDLIKVGNNDAVSYLIELMDNIDFFNNQNIIGEASIINLLDDLIKVDKDSALKILENIIFKFDYINKIRQIDLNNFSKSFISMLKIDFESGLRILRKIYRKEVLSENEQIFILNSIDNITESKEIPDADRQVIIKIYIDFLKPLLMKLNNINSIENKFSYKHARESIIKFAEKLANIGKFEEALFIINKFMKDSDPPIDGSNDKNDPDGSFNYHQKIIEGENTILITSVRGWIPWVLQKFVSIKAKEFIPKIIPLIEELLNDGNYYVRVQACVPLLELAKSRHNVMPGNSRERFLSMETAEMIENISFQALEKEDNQNLALLMEYLVRAFSYMRSLDEKHAKDMFKIFLGLKVKFKNIKDDKKRIEAYEEVIEKITSTLIFYAELRKNAFIDEKFKSVFLDKYSDLQNFNDLTFKEILENLALEGSSGIRTTLAWELNDLSNYKKEYFEIACKYLELLVQNYNNDVYSNIYTFIEKNIETKFEESYKIWQDCLIHEREYIKSNINKENQQNIYWWPYFYNGKILNIILEKKGEKDFLKWFEFLLEYPKEVAIANDLNAAVDKLKKFPKTNKAVTSIFDKLIERNPSRYYDMKKEWLRA